MAKKDRKWHVPELTTKAKILVGLFAFVFIGALATFITLSIINGGILGLQTGEKFDFANKTAVDRKIDAAKVGTDALAKGDDKKAADVYSQAIAAESDPIKKVELAIDHSRMLMYEGKFDEAIVVAKDAEGYSTDKYLITDWEARLYARAKQYSNAAAAYTKAGTLVESPTNTGKYRKQYYDNKASEMTALLEKK